MKLHQIIDRLRLRKRAYQAAFGAAGTPGFEAMKDLAKFCRAFEAGAVPGNHDATLIMAGRREAFFRIWQHLYLEPGQLAVLFGAVNQQGDDE